MLLIIALSAVLVLVGYRMALGCPFRSLLVALSVVVIMPLLDPSLRDQAPAVYALAVMLAYVGIQFVMPLVEGRNFVVSLQMPRATVALAVVRK